jgi:class 3 adenylate cyclase
MAKEVTATVLVTDIVASTVHQTRFGPGEWSRVLYDGGEGASFAEHIRTC